MITKLSEVYASPEYQSFSYAEQQQVKRAFFEKKAASMPEFQILNDSEKNQAFYQIMDEAPAVEGVGVVQLTDEDRARFDAGQPSVTNDPAEEYKKAIWLHDRAVMGDPKAVGEIEMFVGSRSAGNASLLAQLAMGANDLLDDDPNTVGPMMKDRAKLEKMTDYLKGSLNRQDASRVGNAQAVGTFVAIGVESVALNALLVGSIATKGAILTKGIYAGLATSAAEMAPSVGKTAMSTIVPVIAESSVQGIIEVMRSLPQLLNDGSIKGDKAVTENLVQNFGAGVLFDLTLYGAGKAMHKILKPVVNQWRNFDINDTKSLTNMKEAMQDLEGTSFPDAISVYNGAAGGYSENASALKLFGDAGDEVLEKINQSNTRRLTKNLDINTPEGFEVYANGMQHDVEYKDGKLILSQFDHIKLETTSVREANSYLAHYMNTTDATKYSSDILAAARGMNYDVKLRVEARSKISAKAMPIEQLTQTLQPNMNGHIETKTVKKTLGAFLEKANTKEVPFEVVHVKDIDMMKRRAGVFSGNKIYVPDELTIPQDMGDFQNYLDTRLRMLTDTFGGDKTKLPTIQQLREGMSVSKDLNPISLKAQTESLGGKFNQIGKDFEVEFPGNAPQIFHSVGEASDAVFEFRAKTNGISLDDVKTMINRSGRSIEIETPSTGIPKFVVRTLEGDVFDSADTLEILIKEHPEFMPKMPAYLSPRMSFVGATDDLRIIGDLASGTEKELRQYLDNFQLDSKKVASHIEHTVSEGKFGTLSADLVTDPKNRVIVEIPTLGFNKTFNNTTEAKKFLDEDILQFHTMERLANERGVRLDLNSNGKIVASSNKAGSTILHSQEELHKYLGQFPDPEGASEFLSYGDAMLDAESNFQLTQVVKAELARVLPDGGKKLKDTELKRFANMVGAWMNPMNDTIENIHKTAGSTAFTPEMLEIIKDTYGVAAANKVKNINLSKLRIALNSAQHMTAVKSQKAEVIMNTFLRVNGKQLDSNTASVLMKLMEHSPEKWTEAAKSLGFDLGSEHVRILHNTKHFLEYYGNEFGVDLRKMLTDYAPKLRETMLNFMKSDESKKEFAKMTKQEIIRQALGTADVDGIRTVNFFAQHARLEAFIGEGDNKNIVRALKFYIDQGMHAKYSNPVIEVAKEYTRNIGLLPGISPEQTHMISSWLQAFTGERPTTGDAVVSSMSNSITRMLGNVFDGLGTKIGDTKPLGRFYSALAESLYSRGALETMNSAVTYATLGFRPLRGLYNMMQFNNTVGVYGHYANQAMDEMMDGGLFNISKIEQYVQQYMREGIITNKMFASGHNTPKVSEGFFEWSMRNQQNSEILTRAATALTVEKSFTENLPFFISKQIDTKKFKSVTHLDFLDDEVQKQVMGYLEQGDPRTALHLMQTENVRILMGDYDASNYPLAFKGWAGKLFGRFGVYPVNQVALYKRMASTGSAIDRAERILRFGLITTATYEGFKMIGIDYTGFTAWDPLSFSGGPLFKAGQNIMMSAGTGAQAQMARREAVRSYRLLVPFSSQAQKMYQAIESGSNGNIHEALIEAMSGKYTPTSLLTPGMQ